MNSRQIDFAYKVRHALNESADKLPAITADRLSTARKLALSRKKPDGRRVRAQQAVLAGAGNFFDQPLMGLSWLGRMGLALPIIVLAVGLTGLYQVEQQRRISDIADIDALVLSDELPLSAYLDNGFNAYLAKRVEVE
jgi:hypothetical protein